MAAKQYQTIAELFESDLVDIPNAITYYEKAADLFKTEENNALVSCHHASLNDKYIFDLYLFCLLE